MHGERHGPFYRPVEIATRSLAENPRRRRNGQAQNSFLVELQAQVETERLFLVFRPLLNAFARQFDEDVRLIPTDSFNTLQRNLRIGY